MSDNFKIGGGNKLQPFIPKGNGDKSGEYTNKSGTQRTVRVTNCLIKNVPNKYNFKNSKLVKRVSYVSLCLKGTDIPITSKPNSVIKKMINGYIVSERYYNNYGEAYLDIDYTCHGNPKTHPVVPHIHKWNKDKNNILKRQKWEDFE